MKPLGEVFKQIIFIVISLVATFLLGLVPGALGVTFSSSEITLLRLGFFNTLLLIDILWIVKQNALQNIKQYELWKISNDGDLELANIRTSFFKIVQNSYGMRDIFTVHFLKEFQKMARIISDAAEKQELRVIADHFLSVDNVLDAFSGDENRIWRYTWEIDPEEMLFDDIQWKHYFEATANLVKKEIKNIKCILIIKSLDLVEKPRIRKLLDFFKTNKGMDCKIILKRDYDRVREDTDIPLIYLDFGIYGNRLLFLTEQYEPAIIGTFTKDNNLIIRYINFFDTMWSAKSITMRNPSEDKKIVTLEELFAFDAQPPSEDNI